MEKELKKVSIIVPVYNVEKYINRCIESLVKQSYKNIEIILVDDGSPDNCPKICDEWAKKDNRIKVIHKENGGLSEARNYGIDVATGDYIGFVDSDDLVSVEMYKALIELLESNDADISICNWSGFNEGVLPKYSFSNNVYLIRDCNTAIIKLLKGEISNSACNKLYRKELFHNLRFPIGKKYEDLSIIHRLISKAKKIIITDSKLYGYLRDRSDSITNIISVNNIEDYIDASNKRYNDLKDNSDILYYLNISKANDIFKLHIMITNVKDYSLYNNEKVLLEYMFLKRLINFKNIIGFLSGTTLRGKILKCILLLDRKLFWKIRTRRKSNSEV